MKECGWKIYVHQHFFFSPNNNYFSPKMMVDLGENRMAAGRKNQSCPSVHPSINQSYLTAYMAERSKNAENISKGEA